MVNCVACGRTDRCRLKNQKQFRKFDITKYPLDFINQCRELAKQSDQRKQNLEKLEQWPSDPEICNQCGTSVERKFISYVPPHNDESRLNDEDMELELEDSIVNNGDFYGAESDSEAEEDVAHIEEYFGSEFGSDNEDDFANEPLQQFTADNISLNAVQSRNILRKGTSSHSSCTFGCSEGSKMKVPKNLRMQLIADYRFYVPENSVMCCNHLDTEDWWPLVCQRNRPISIDDYPDIFELQQEYISYLKKGSNKGFFDLDNLNSIKPSTFEAWFGHNKEQFHDILSESQCTKRQLALFLCKMRNNIPNKNIGTLFGISGPYVGKEIAKAVGKMNNTLVPNHLNKSREELLHHVTPTAKILFDLQPNELALTWDGTYRHIEKSTCYRFQQMSYSGQKKDNIYKIMGIICTDGYAARVIVPFEGSKSDCPITEECFEEHADKLNIIQPGDTMIADRGFMRVEKTFTDRGLKFFTPKSKEAGNKQLTTMQANESRRVTHVRFIVEQFYGRLQSKYKFFAGTVRNVSLKWDAKAYSICAALLNKFHTFIETDKEYPGLAEHLKARMTVENHLADMVAAIKPNLTITKPPFELIDHNTIATTFPQLSEHDLHMISCGPYQIKNARSYFGHIPDPNKGTFALEWYSSSRSPLNYQQYGISIDTTNAILVRGGIDSRFQKNKNRKPLVLFDTSKTGPVAISEYWCNCDSGARTAGCCSHVMSVIWYLCYAHDKNVIPPNDNLPQIMHNRP